jgi:HemY protein
MRLIVGFLLLFAVAVVAAALLGTNDGIVTMTWRGWRAELSLNLFLFAVVAAAAVLVSAVLAFRAVVTLPQRARDWRATRRDRVAQAALRDALAQYFGGRYSRAQRAAQRALAVQADTPEMPQDNDFTVLAHLLAAGSAHRLQDRGRRDAGLNEALRVAAGSAAARPAQEGARLLAAEWAIDDRDPTRAMDHLAELPPGVARRTQALRLRLAATRLARQPLEALRTARLLAKHQAFSRTAAQGLLRSLAFEALDSARDIDQLRRVWLQFDAADRRDSWVLARAATQAAGMGAPEEARGWLLAGWSDIGTRGADERAVLCDALLSLAEGIGADWLPRVEALAQQLPADGHAALVAGVVCRRRGLWGVGGRYLQQAAEEPGLDTRLRRLAWREIAEQAQSDGHEARATAAFAAAARLD